MGLTLGIVALLYVLVTFGTYYYIAARTRDEDQAAKYVLLAVKGFTCAGAVGILLVALLGEDVGTKWPWLMFGPSLLMAVILWYIVRTEPAEISKVPVATVFAGMCCAVPVNIAMMGVAMMILGS